jgi:hypothetical protein
MKFNLVSIEPSEFKHAACWYELAELIQHGFLRAGFECSTSINRFAPNRRNIVFGVMHVTPEMERLIPKDTLFFNTEQLITLSEEFNHQSYMNIRFLAQKGYGFIDYSVHNVRVLESWGAPEVILMPLGYVPELDRLQKAKPIYDLLFYGGRNQRRIEVLNQIRNAGVNFHYLNGVYGPDRDNFIEQSKVVLNLHLYPSEIFELVRVNYLMHNKVCVLTELNASTKIEQELKELFVCSSREAIASTALELAHCPDMIKEKSSTAYDWLRSRPQELIIKNLFTN